MHIYLTGFMGSGKTSVGKILAQRLGCEFVDLDEAIQQRAGMTVSEIFERLGETEFRRLESVELEAIPDSVPTVVATGGGTMIDASNRRLMDERGTSIWLNAPLSVIMDRLEAADLDMRPLFGDHSDVEKLFESRLEIYERSARVVRIDKDAGADQVAESVETVLES